MATKGISILMPTTDSHLRRVRNFPEANSDCLQTWRGVYFLLSFPSLIIWLMVAGTKYRVDPYNDMGGIYDGTMNAMSIARAPFLIGLIWNAGLFGLIFNIKRLPWPTFISVVDFCLWGALVNGTVFTGILFFPHYLGKVTQRGNLHWDPALGELICLSILTVWQFVVFVYSVMETPFVRKRKARRRSQDSGLERALSADVRSSHELETIESRSEVPSKVPSIRG